MLRLSRNEKPMHRAGEQCRTPSNGLSPASCVLAEDKGDKTVQN